MQLIPPDSGSRQSIRSSESYEEWVAVPAFGFLGLAPLLVPRVRTRMHRVRCHVGGSCKRRKVFFGPFQNYPEVYHSPGNLFTDPNQYISTGEI